MACFSPSISSTVLTTRPAAAIAGVASSASFYSRHNLRSTTALGVGRLRGRRFISTKRSAGGLTEIEPDLVEEKRDQWATGGISPDDFVYGEYDGHHMYFESGEKTSFWKALKEEYDSVEPPSGFQGLISWLFFPAVITGLAYNAPGEYLYIGAAVFVVVFCGIEMGKPDKPHNFEPQIYNLEKASRDKLISDYNTMDIWDFNEQYGELWDFTIKRDKL